MLTAAAVIGALRVNVFAMYYRVTGTWPVKATDTLSLKYFLFNSTKAFPMNDTLHNIQVFDKVLELNRA